MPQFQNPFLRGWYGAEEARDRSTANNIGERLGLLSIQNQMEMAPVQRELMQLKLQQARQGPQPKWQVSERFTPDGRKEKVLVDLNNPSNVVPFGGAEAEGIMAVNAGNQMLLLGNRSGQPRGMPIPIGVSPNTSATLGQSQQQFNTMFPIRAAQAGADIARLNWETGGGPAAIPGLLPPPMMPQNAPLAAPQATPQGMMIPPAVQAQRDAEAARIRGREVTGGGIPNASVVQGSQPPGPQTFVPPGTQMGAIPQAPASQPGGAVRLPPRLQAQVAAAQQTPPAGYRNAGGGRLEPIPGGPADQLTTTQKDELKDIRRTVDAGKKLSAMFNPEYVGIAGTMGEVWDKYGTQLVPFAGGAGNESRVQFRALASDLENQYIKAISGATVPESEVPRLRRAIPTPSDSPMQYKAKLDQMIINLDGLPAIIAAKSSGTNMQGWSIKPIP